MDYLQSVPSIRVLATIFGSSCQTLVNSRMTRRAGWEYWVPLQTLISRGDWGSRIWFLTHSLEMVSLFWHVIVVVRSLSCVQLLHRHGLQHTRLPCPSLCPGVMSTFKCNVCVFSIRHTHGSYHDCLPNLRGCRGWVFRRGHASYVSETSSLLAKSKLLKVNSENLVSEVRKVGASRDSSVLPRDTGQGHLLCLWMTCRSTGWVVFGEERVSSQQDRKEQGWSPGESVSSNCSTWRWALPPSLYAGEIKIPRKCIIAYDQKTIIW